MASTRSNAIAGIRVQFAGVGKQIFQGREVIVVRGSLNPEYFPSIEVPYYQRMEMEEGKQGELIKVVAPDGLGFPEDILLCVTGCDVSLPNGSEAILVTNEQLRLLDGHQRFAAAMKRIKEGQTSQPFGIKLFIGTTIDEEVDAFHQINHKRTPVVRNVMIRNWQDSSIIKAIREAEKEGKIPQLSWDQRNKNGDIMHAITLMNLMIILHGGFNSTDIDDVRAKLAELQDAKGTATLMENTIEFFRVLDKIFDDPTKGQFKYRASLMRGLATLFKADDSFWNHDKLVVKSDAIKKLRTIKLETIVFGLSLSGINSMADIFREHLRKGKRTGTPRQNAQ